MNVAILMSTYNGEKYLKEQIDSILCQIGDFNADLWVRDDGSKDSTQNILDDYAKRGDLRWYTGNNLGPAKSFIDLIKKTSGYDYYAFADQDDYWHKDKLQHAIDTLENTNKPCLYCANAELVDEQLNLIGRNVYKRSPRTDLKTISCAGGLLGCTFVFNKALAEVIQGNPIPMKIVMHDFYVAELCTALGGSIVFDNYTQMSYRQHQNNVVGVSYGIIGTVKGRIKDITTTQKNSIADQAASILELYADEMSDESRYWLIKIKKYRESVFSRFLLAFSPTTKYINRNMGMKIRCSILLGNR